MYKSIIINKKVIINNFYEFNLIENDIKNKIKHGLNI